MTIIDDENNLKSFVTNVMMSEFPDMDFDTGLKFIQKAYEASVFSSTSDAQLLEWYENRFKPNLFLLDENEYTIAAIQSLRIQFLIAGTDFGTSRQRDMGQKWSDTIRGYLGELGVKQVLKRKFNLEISLGHDPGNLEDYLPTDIHQVKKTSESIYRNPNINVSIKTTKSNGIWLDIPGEQFTHSDVYILALIGVEVNHLFSFFKHISVFKDKVLKRGLDNNCINEIEANQIYDKVPSFHKVYGYIPGIITSDTNIDRYTYEGKKGRTNYTITNWSGKYERNYLDEIKREQSVNNVKFAGIGEFTQSNRHIFGLKSLRYSEKDWQEKLVNLI